jgi:hypothetical protein
MRVRLLVQQYNNNDGSRSVTHRSLISITGVLAVQSVDYLLQPAALVIYS